MIGVFDSGLGGLSVLAAIAEAMPQLDLVYLADSAQLPYGNKSQEFISARVHSIARQLADSGCELVVVACNTATTTAIHSLRQQLPNTVIVGIEPGIKPAAQTTLSGHIAVLATEATAASQRLANLIANHAADKRVDIIPCPGWATHIEMLQPDDNAFRAEVAMKIQPLLDAGADRIVLGCTHYSFLTPLITPLLPEGAAIVDVATAVARQVSRLLNNHNGERKLLLQATARPEHLAAALPALGLGYLSSRITGCEHIPL